MPAGEHGKIPQQSIVVIEDDVEIGANTTIDRPAVGETRIGAGTKIDNLVQIAHGVRSDRTRCWRRRSASPAAPTLGDHVVLAGQVGVAGHVEIGDGARATAQTGIPNSVEAGSVRVRLSRDRQPRLAEVVRGVPPAARAEEASAGSRRTARRARARAAASEPQSARRASSAVCHNSKSNECSGIETPAAALACRRRGGAGRAVSLGARRAAAVQAAVTATPPPVPDHDAPERADRHALRGSLDADRPRAAVVSRRLEGRAAGTHRVRAPVRAPDVQGLEERRARGAHLVHLERRRAEQRLHDRGHDGVLGDGAGPVPAAHAVARGRPDGHAAHRQRHVQTRAGGRQGRAADARREPPYGRLSEIIYDQAFTVHPYKHQPIGAMADLEAASIDDVRDFYRTYYVPSNATLTIVGDFDPAQAAQLVERYFGRIPKPDHAVPRDIPAEPPHAQGTARHARRDWPLPVGGRRATTSPTTGTPTRIRCTWRRRSCRTARARESTGSWCTRPGIALAACGGGQHHRAPEPVLRGGHRAARARRRQPPRRR